MTCSPWRGPLIRMRARSVRKGGTLMNAYRPRSYEYTYICKWYPSAKIELCATTVPLTISKWGRLFLLSFLAALDCALISLGCKWAGTELWRTGFSSSRGATELVLFCTFLQARDTSGTPYSISSETGRPGPWRAAPRLPGVWDETLSKSAAPFPAQKIVL